MPNGKPAGVPCVQLDEQMRCKLFGRPERPAVCASLRPHEDMCGDRRDEALLRLTWLEAQTAPGTASHGDGSRGKDSRVEWPQRTQKRRDRRSDK
jgi:hypothetical protein